ncbi:DNA-binding SARP family transcriptional activator [Prauserella shujinwangii]|uniref:DNA-binding SARP family transcriptional activator n=1 Tax=Prauserella shujinwangii TaxID=1453103 RepID=A0A2T0LW11_9PSEU|nr:BTAD domain-containing putative transcriptional regulator [Prauserella shujinwangii]PRX48206.1 DNA-binding SARP family transcriptional activator [Prauserella shujinwangii]
MNAISFRILGPLDVEVAGRAVPLGGTKPRLLLATLLLRPDTAVSAETLVDVLWPETPPRSAHANLRTYVHNLRRRLDAAAPGLGDRLGSRTAGYLVHTEPGELDASRFEELTVRAQRTLAEENAERGLALLDAAEELWRGEVLQDLPHSHRWSATVARLGELRLSARQRRLETRIALGHCDEAVIELRGLLADHPLCEELWERLMLALDAGGRRAEALRAFAEAEQVLRAELDAAPGPRLRRLHSALTGDDGAPEPGERALPVCQLPLDLPDFTGRGRIVAELVTLLRERHAQGVPAVAVLSGAPGVGKSAVAVHVAHAVRALFPDGQLHVDLAGTADRPREPRDVLGELLRALGVADAALPHTVPERAALLRSRLARRRLCVVLEDARDAAQVRPLLPGTGTSAVLVTTRTRIPDVPGAHAVALDVLPEDDAARLLAAIVGERRAGAEPGAAAAILRSCGHLPLAIRVAGARLAHRPGWTLGTLAERLADEHRRLDELRAGETEVRASVSLSYAQLSPTAARAFRGLGRLGPVRFPGWVVAALLDRPEADDVLDTLVDANLVGLVGTDTTGLPRYRLHDLLRCYAAERAGPEDPRAGVRRVLERYVALATGAGERMPIDFFGVPAGEPPPLPAGADRLLADPAAWFEAEHRTAVAAVDLAVRHGFDDLAWRLAAALTPYFDLRAHLEDWQHTHGVALAAARRTGDRRAQAIVLRDLAQNLLYQDRYSDALAGFTESRTLFTEVADERGIATALAGIGTVLRILGQPRRALETCEEALELFRRAGARHGEAVALIAIGAAWLGLGRTAEAERWFTDARALAAAIGDRHREAHALNRLGLLHQRRGNLAAAREHVDRAIGIFTELGDHHCIGYANQHLGELCLRSGDLAHARLLLSNSLTVHRRTGDRRSEAEVAELLGQLHHRLGQPGRAHRFAARAGELWHELSAPAVQ